MSNLYDMHKVATYKDFLDQAIPLLPCSIWDYGDVHEFPYTQLLYQSLSSSVSYITNQTYDIKWLLHE